MTTNSIGDRARFAGELLAAIARRPSLAPTLARQIVKLAPARWWRQAPFLPLPSPDYVRFRTVTSTGAEETLPAIGEIIDWLEWCRSMRSLPER